MQEKVDVASVGRGGVSLTFPLIEMSKLKHTYTGENR